MSAANWLQFILLIVLLAISTPLLGSYMAKVFGGGRAPGDRVFGPVERLVYRAARIDEKREQRWTVYALSVLAFSVVSLLVLYLMQRFQGVLPVNPTKAGAVPPFLSFNTAISFTTNTNWQSYAGETTMSYLTQMAGLAFHNFVSAATGLAVAMAFVRGLTRRKSDTLGNFWVDLTRACMRILLPLAFVGALVLGASGVIQNFHGFTPVKTVQAQTQVQLTPQQIPGGPVASQESIKELGTNGGGFYNANSAHPYESPNGFTNMFEIWFLLMIPFALPWTFGKLAKDRKQGLAVLTAMVVLWVGAALVAMTAESVANPKLAGQAIAQQRTSAQSGGNMEGKEVRFGSAASGLFGSSTTGTSTGAVDSMHDSFMPIGGMVPMFNMMLGEVSPGGVGSGLYGMLLLALLSVFIAGLMVGRTPEYLGKKIESREMKLVVVYILILPLVILGFTAVTVLLTTAKASLLNPGPHGLSEAIYAYTSASNNNGSAFAGLSANTDWFNVTLAMCMLAGRFLLMIPALAIAGSLGRKQYSPPTAGTFPTGTATFAFLLVAVALIVGGLTYFPVLSLGPIVEHLGL